MATASEGRAQPPAEASSAERLWGWITTTDHKRIGILYLATTFIFLLIGGIEALLLRLQLAGPGGRVLDPNAYNATFTMHGTTMIFLVVMPMLLGFANYFVPLMIGARDMAFPRLNALSYWLLLFGGLFLYFSLMAGSTPAVGWFAYSPLTERPYAMDFGPDYWALALLVTSAGTIATAINLIVTVIRLRAPGMTWLRMPVFVWMSFVTGVLIIAAVPSLSAAQFMLVFDRNLGTHFFDSQAGADQLLWQHLFWYFGHPEVYIMVLPAFGILSEVIPVFSRKPLFGYSFVVLSGVAIAFLSMAVWAHHMFTVGMGLTADTAFGISSMLIAVPTGVKVLSWIATMWGGRLRLTSAMLFAVAFLILFPMGGVTGVQFATVPIDQVVHDSYYIVAHFHYVLFGGTFFGIMAGVYYWFPKMFGRLLNEKLGKVHFWLQFVGFNLTFLPMHLLGLMGMQRRTYTYPDLPGWGSWNLAETAGAFMIAVSILVLIWNVFVTLRHGQRAGNNPWDGWTLEWATTSPPLPENFRTVPPVRGRRPLWELRQLPESSSGTGREATPSPRAAGAVEASGHAVEEPSRGLSTPSLGVLIFVLAELTLFGAFIVTYLIYRHRSPGGPGPNDLAVLRTALFSLALWASSGTLVWGESRLDRGDQRGFRIGVLATVLLGAIFLVGQVTEYTRMYAEGITIGRNLFTSAFYTLTGFHGAHVAIGLVVLCVLAWLAFRGDVRQDRPEGARAVSVYWHFVDGVWVVIFSVVYLLALV